MRPMIKIHHRLGHSPAHAPLALDSLYDLESMLWLYIIVTDIKVRVQNIVLLPHDSSYSWVLKNQEWEMRKWEMRKWEMRKWGNEEMGKLMTAIMIMDHAGTHEFSMKMQLDVHLFKLMRCSS